jgi:hypothetical protein
MRANDSTFDEPPIQLRMRKLPMIETSEITASTTPSSRSHLLGEPVGDLVFKMRGGEHHGRIVRLRSLKCTIGSSADCTLRLCAPGVRGLHCLVIRGEAGAVVRRWSPDTQLNGRTFDDALLKVGDRLQIGPIELELLESEPSETNSPAHIAQLVGLKLPANIPVNAMIPPAPSAELVDQITQQVQAKVQKQQRRHRLQLRKKLSATKSRLARLKKQIRRLKHSMRGQATEQQQHQTRIASAQAAQQTAEQQVLLTQLELQSRIQLLDQLRSDLAAAQQQCREDGQRWTLEKQELLQSLTLKQAEYQQLDQQARKQQKTVEQLQIELRIAKQVSDESELQALQMQLTQSLCEQSRLKAELQELLQTHQQTSCDLGELYQRHREANESVELLTAEERQAQATIAALNEKIETLEVELLTATEAKEQLHTQLAAMQAALSMEQTQATAELTDALHTTQASLQSLQEQAVTDHACLAQQRIRIAELEQLHEEQQHKFQALQLEELTHQADASLENAQIREELGLAKIHLQDAVSSHATALESLENERVSLQNELEQLRITLNELERAHQLQANEAEQKLQVLTAEVERLQQELVTAAAIPVIETPAVNLAEIEQAWQAKLEAAFQERDALQASQLDLIEQLSEQRHLADAQLDQRDALLSQIRAEVREQMLVWETEKADLLSQLSQRSTLPAVVNTPQEQHEQPILEQHQEQNLHLVDASAETEAPVAESAVLAYPTEEAALAEHASWQSDWQSCMPSAEEDLPIADNEPYRASFPADQETEAEEANPSEPAAESVSEARASAGDEDAALDAVLARLGAAGILKGNAAAPVEFETPQPKYTPPSFLPTHFEEEDEEPVAEVETPEVEVMEEPQPEIVEAPVNTITPMPSMQPSETPVASHADEDDSIQDYMNKLMKRVRGESVANAFTAKQSPAAAVPEKPTEVAPEAPVAHDPIPEHEYMPRAQAPEVKVDLSALRELAVSSAHQAIDLSRVRGQKQRALGYAFAAICAFVAGNVLLYYGQQYGMRWAAFAAIASFGLGTHWVIQRLKLMRPTKYKQHKSAGPQLVPREKMQVTRTTIVEPAQVPSPPEH